MRLTVVLFFTSTLFSLGCSDDITVCIPFTIRPCICGNGKLGDQYCTRDGNSWDWCYHCDTNLDGGPAALIKWVTINPGTFQMGSPTTEKCRIAKYETQHQVTLNNKFEIQDTEVTQGQFFSMMGYNPSNAPYCGESCPVEHLSWHEAVAYCSRLSYKAGLTACSSCTGSGKNLTCQEVPSYSGQKIYLCPGYRLPTEAEWEYAYRAGTKSAFYNGGITNCYSGSGMDPNAEKIAWYKYNSGGDTHQVGQKKPNAWGLYDMAGNVWEWCHDWYQEDLGASSVTDPWGPSTGYYRLMRGGSWFRYPYELRAAYRYAHGGSSRHGSAGFRCVRTLKP